ncbi:hypothetical protein ABW19_dt0200748 [Dactylella cylindrospora]|nr:hypothetical protein ABW19_dt0200748 [Dactylella cylindrospora]
MASGPAPPNEGVDDADTQDPYGIANISGFYGPGNTLCYILIVIAFHIDLLSWIYGTLKKPNPTDGNVLPHPRNYHNPSQLSTIARWIGPNRSRAASPDISLGGRASSQSPERLRGTRLQVGSSGISGIGLNVNLILLIVYHIYVLVDLKSRMARYEPVQSNPVSSDVGSLLTTIMIYSVTEYLTRLTLYLAMVYIFFAIDVGAAREHLERKVLYHCYFITATYIAFSVTMIQTRLSGNSAGCSRWTRASPSKNDVLDAYSVWMDRLLLNSQTTSATERPPPGIIHIWCVLKSFCDRWTDSRTYTAPFFFLGGSFVFYVFCILMSAMMMNAPRRPFAVLSGQRISSRSITRVLYNFITITCWLGLAAHWIEDLLIGGVETLSTLILRGFKFLPNSPSSFSDMDQHFAVAGGAISVVFSIYSAYKHF